MDDFELATRLPSLKTEENFSGCWVVERLVIIQGRMAEWSKALVLGTSHCGGAGSNPVPVI